MNVEEFITEKAQRWGDHEYSRIEAARLRAVRWMRSNLGKKPPKHIKRSLDEARTLEEMYVAFMDSKDMREWQLKKNDDPDFDTPPPLPRAGKVAVTRDNATTLLAALSARLRREGHA